MEVIVVYQVRDRHTPTLLERFKCKSKNGNNGRKNWGAFINSQHFKGRRACYNFGMGIRMINKWVNYSQELTQTKQQVG
jgi:hypothetical protein